MVVSISNRFIILYLFRSFTTGFGTSISLFIYLFFFFGGEGEGWRPSQAKNFQSTQRHYTSYFFSAVLTTRTQALEIKARDK